MSMPDFGILETSSIQIGDYELDELGYKLGIREHAMMTDELGHESDGTTVVTL